MSAADTSPVLYHLALADEWAAAQAAGGPYRRSTIGRSLADEGFVHCSFAGQVRGVADRFYGGRADVVLLEIDPARFAAEVRVEDLIGAGERFPHVYGPIPLAAVVRATPVALGPDGRLVLDGLLDG
jgi:uncharacterized protein (DUF952 family)